MGVNAFLQTQEGFVNAPLKAGWLTPLIQVYLL